MTEPKLKEQLRRVGTEKKLSKEYTLYLNIIIKLSDKKS